MLSKLVIYNPTSGNGKGNKIAQEFISFLKDNRITFEPVATTAHQSTCKVIRDVLDPYKHDGLVVVGGDGTLNDAINGILHRDIPMGVIPAGTGNDFSKMLVLGRNKKEIFETAINGREISIDVGICNNKFFLNGVGIGFDGEIVAAMRGKKKFLKGQAAYYYEVLKILSTYKEKNVKYALDQQAYDKDLILLTIANGSTFGGGFQLTPNAKINDGLLDICEIGKVSPFSRFLNLPKLQDGTHYKMDNVKFHQAKRIEILPNPLLNAHIDGEFLGSPPFEIYVKENFLKVLVQS